MDRNDCYIRRNRMEDKLKQVFKQLFNIKPEDFREDLDVNSVRGWDSMNHLNLIIALEKSFGVSFTNEEVIQMASVKSIIETLRKKNERKIV